MGDRVLRAVRTIRDRRECFHDEIVTVVSTGLERMICEGCGHLSFRYPAELSGKVERSRFLRQVDRAAGPLQIP